MIFICQIYHTYVLVLFHHDNLKFILIISPDYLECISSTTTMMETTNLPGWAIAVIALALLLLTVAIVGGVVYAAYRRTGPWYPCTRVIREQASD